jgi:hypothetical protein
MLLDDGFTFAVISLMVTEFVVETIIEDPDPPNEGAPYRPPPVAPAPLFASAPSRRFVFGLYVVFGLYAAYGVALICGRQIGRARTNLILAFNSFAAANDGTFGALRACGLVFWPAQKGMSHVYAAS